MSDSRPPVDVDLTLIEAMRRMTVRERLEQNDRALDAVLELRRAFAASKPHDPAR